MAFRLCVTPTFDGILFGSLASGSFDAQDHN